MDYCFHIGSTDTNARSLAPLSRPPELQSSRRSGEAVSEDGGPSAMGQGAVREGARDVEMGSRTMLFLALDTVRLWRIVYHCYSGDCRIRYERAP